MTADFAWSRSGRFRTCFGEDLRQACLLRFMNWGLHVPTVEYVGWLMALNLERGMDGHDPNRQ